MADILLIFFAVTVKRLARISWNLDLRDIFIDRVKQGLCFDLRVRHFVCVGMLSVCASRLQPYAFTDCHNIVNHNVISTQKVLRQFTATHSICKGVYFLAVSTWRSFSGSFRSYTHLTRSTELPVKSFLPFTLCLHSPCSKRQWPAWNTKNQNYRANPCSKR